MIPEWQEVFTDNRREQSHIRVSELLGNRGTHSQVSDDRSCPSSFGLPAGYDPVSSQTSTILYGSRCLAEAGSTADSLTSVDGCASQESAEKEGELGADLCMIRVLDPVKRSRRIETKRTVAAWLLGEGSKLENTLFRWAVQNWKTSRMLWSLWLTGLAFGLLTLLEWIPVSLVYLSMLMLPLPGFSSLVLSVDLLKDVFEQFEFYLISLLQVALATAAVLMLPDQRAVFWFCYSPTMVIATFIDAYPQRYRCRFSRMFFSAMIAILIFWTLSLTFRLIQYTDREFKFANLEGRLATVSSHIMLTLTAFCCKNLFFAFCKPDHLVIIRNATRTLHVPVRKLQEHHTDSTDHTLSQNGPNVEKWVRLDRQGTNLSIDMDM